MTDQPGRPDDAQERLPATRPSSAPVPAERFSAPPSARRLELTPERIGRIVRQSANARWVGFLAVTIVSLFVIGYYFYEVGLPGGLTQPRLDAAAEHQQVTAVERGYNIYQANCAQCHGVDGEGAVGPALNRQDKLFAHLNPDYLRNILTVGGRYACGNADSLMPVWADTGNPAGPLNYLQIDNLIAFLRAEQGHEYRVMDPDLWEPVVDPDTGEEETFEGWVDPDFEFAPGSTPFPDCYLDEFTSGPAPSAGASPGASPGPSAPAGAVTVEEAALNIQFVNRELSVPADTPFTIAFDNQDAGQPHNIEIKDSGGASVFKGDLITGPAQTTYSVNGLAAGSYPYVCTVHLNMTGTLTAGD